MKNLQASYISDQNIINVTYPVTLAKVSESPVKIDPAVLFLETLIVIICIDYY